jgi:hypothetical protein
VAILQTYLNHTLNKKHKERQLRRLPESLCWLSAGNLYVLSLCYTLQHFRRVVATLPAIALDMGEALLIGGLNLRSGVEFAIITGLVYVGIRVAA